MVKKVGKSKLKVGRPRFDKPLGTILGHYELVGYTQQYSISHVIMNRKSYEYRARYFLWKCIDCGHVRKDTLTIITANVKKGTKCTVCHRKEIFNEVGKTYGVYTVKDIVGFNSKNLNDVEVVLQCKCGASRNATLASFIRLGSPTYCNECRPRTTLRLKPTPISKTPASPLPGAYQDMGSVRSYFEYKGDKSKLGNMLMFRPYTYQFNSTAPEFQDSFLTAAQ